MLNDQNKSAHQRRAVTVLETTVALALLTGGIVLTAQILAVCARQRHSAEQLLVAQLEAANALERISTMPYDGVTSSALREMSLSKDAQATLVGGQLTATVENPSDSSPSHKRIHVEVAWPIGDGPPRTVELTAWKYDLPPTAAGR